MTRPHGWLALCCLHGAASLLCFWTGAAAVDAFTWHAGRWAQQPWTLWTSAWVHLTTPHLVGNLLVLGAYLTIGWVARLDGRCTWAWLLSWPLVALSLLAWPDIHFVAGLSGLLHAGALVVAAHLALQRLPIRHARFWGLLLGAAVLLKVLLEQAWRQPVVWDSANGFFVVQAAHLAGVFWGSVLGLATGWPRRKTGEPSH